jgi:hypothetical protein
MHKELFGLSIFTLQKIKVFLEILIMAIGWPLDELVASLEI